MDLTSRTSHVGVPMPIINFTAVAGLQGITSVFHTFTLLFSAAPAVQLKGPLLTIIVSDSSRNVSLRILNSIRVRYE